LITVNALTLRFFSSLPEKMKLPGCVQGGDGFFMGHKRIIQEFIYYWY
jgi:hypothetical protein